MIPGRIVVTPSEQGYVYEGTSRITPNHQGADSGAGRFSELVAPTGFEPVFEEPPFERRLGRRNPLAGEARRGPPFLGFRRGPSD